jgi:hypothetical protein
VTFDDANVFWLPEQKMVMKRTASIVSVTQLGQVGEFSLLKKVFNKFLSWCIWDPVNLLVENRAGGSGITWDTMKHHHQLLV